MVYGTGSQWFKSEANPSSCDRLKTGLSKLLAGMAEINPALPDLQKTELRYRFALSWVSLLSQPCQHPCDISCGVAENAVVGLVHHTHFYACPIPLASVWCWAHNQASLVQAVGCCSCPTSKRHLNNVQNHGLTFPGCMMLGLVRDGAHLKGRLHHHQWQLGAGHSSILKGRISSQPKRLDRKSHVVPPAVEQGWSTVGLSPHWSTMRSGRGHQMAWPAELAAKAELSQVLMVLAGGVWSCHLGRGRACGSTRS